MSVTVVRRSEPCIAEDKGRFFAKWREYFSDGCNKQRRRALDADTKAQAKKKARELMVELEDADASAPPAQDPNAPTQTPIAKVVEAYVAHLMATKTETVQRNDLSVLRDAFGECCEALKYSAKWHALVETARVRNRKLKVIQIPGIQAPYFEAITGPIVAKWIADQMVARKLSSRSANRRREVIRHLFNWSRQFYNVRLPGPNPVSGDTSKGIIGVTKYKESEPAVRYLRESQIGQQLNVFAGDAKMQAMIATYIFAGLRREEAIWLTKDDVELDSTGRRWIHVRAKEIDGVRWKPKTGKDRIVPVSDHLAHYLDAFDSPPFTPWLFPTAKGRRWMPRNLNTVLNRKNKKAGLDWSFMDYRHTFGSQLAQRGVDLYQISNWMGNSPDVCRKHYARLDPKSQAAASLVLFGPAPGQQTVEPGKLRVG